EDLFHRSARTDGQVRTVLDVRVPKTIAMAFLEPPCRNTRFGVHAHMTCAVAALGELFLQRAALDLARLDTTFPLQDLNELRDAAAGHFTAQQNGLFQHFRRD